VRTQIAGEDDHSQAAQGVEAEGTASPVRRRSQTRGEDREQSKAAGPHQVRAQKVGGLRLDQSKAAGQVEDVVVAPAVRGVVEKEDGYRKQCHKAAHPQQNAAWPLPVVAEGEQSDGQHALLGLEGQDPQQSGERGAPAARSVERQQNEEQIEHVHAAEVESPLHHRVARGEESYSGKRGQSAAEFAEDQCVDRREAAQRAEDGDKAQRSVADAHHARECSSNVEVDGRVEIGRERSRWRGVQRQAAAEVADRCENAVLNPVVLEGKVHPPQRGENKQRDHQRGERGQQTT